MIRVRRVQAAYAVVAFSLLLLGSGSYAKDSPNTQAKNLKYTTVEWTDLMPTADIEALMTPPEYVTDVPEGGFEDETQAANRGTLGSTMNSGKTDRYQQALTSTSVVPAMDGQAIRLAGFIVPLEFNEQKLVKQFFLVPYFGACIHVPPPPPNQIILVNYPKGLKVDALDDPFWVSGTLTTTITQNDMAESAYSMTLHKYQLYKN